MQSFLFPVSSETAVAQVEYEQKADLSQWFTPSWAAAELVSRYFPDLTESDLVLEPSCGPGAFLQAIPDHVTAVGVEIDPVLAEIARRNTGREIITGDFTTVDLPEGVTAMIGNPPYVMEVFNAFMERAHRILPELSRVGMLIPAYFMSNQNRVLSWSDKWSLSFDIVPRTLFPGLSFPIGFGVFSKDKRRNLVGFALFGETAAVKNLTKRAQEVLQDGRPYRSVWRALVEDTMEMLGGTATTKQIYQAIEPKRPTENAFWRDKVRQQLSLHYQSLGDGMWTTRLAAS